MIEAEQARADWRQMDEASYTSQHGGRLWAESAGEGQGTTMRLWLPTPARVVDDGRPDPA